MAEQKNMKLAIVVCSKLKVSKPFLHIPIKNAPINLELIRIIQSIQGFRKEINPGLYKGKCNFGHSSRQEKISFFFSTKTWFEYSLEGPLPQLGLSTYVFMYEHRKYSQVLMERGTFSIAMYDTAAWMKQRINHSSIDMVLFWMKKYR